MLATTLLDDEARSGPAKAAVERSVLCMYITHFVLAVDYFIVVPTMYLYLEHDLGGDKKFLGIIISAFFIAKLLAAPVAAIAADRFGTRATFVLSLLVCAAGNVLYSGARNQNMLLISRVVAGIGAGVDGVTFGYVAQATPAKQVTQGIATLMWAFSVGTVVSPAASAVVAWAMGTKQTALWLLTINVYTVPALATAVLCLVLAVVAAAILVESPSQRRNEPEQGAPAGLPFRPYRRSAAAPLVTVVLFVCGAAWACTFVGSTFVTANVPLMHHQFGWGAKQTTACFTVIGVSRVLTISAFRKYVAQRGPENSDDRAVFAIAALFVGLGGALCTSLTNFDSPLSGTVGFWQYAVGAILLNSGGSIAGASVGGTFRRLKSGSASNLYMSMYTSANNLARIMGALWAGFAVLPARPDDTDFAIGAAAACVAVYWLLWLMVWRAGGITFSNDETTVSRSVSRYVTDDETPMTTPV